MLSLFLPKYQTMRIITLLFLILPSISVFSQNIGQTGKDTLLNYTDINGLKQGRWVKKYFNGQTKYEGYFVNDKPRGIFKRYNEQGQLSSVMNYYDNKNQATVTFFYPGGKIAIKGKYIDKNKDSIWDYYTQDSVLITKEAYKNGVEHGKWQWYYLNGNLKEEKTFADGKPEGIWLSYYPDGTKKMETFFIAGLREGTIKTWYEDGKLLLYGQYRKDMCTGTWKMYDENGILKQQIEYDQNGLPKNLDKLQLEETKMLNDLEMNSKNLPDPDNFINNPEMYLKEMQRSVQQKK